MALRVVEPTEDGGWGRSAVYFAEGDGLEFQMSDVPAIRPGPWAEDLGGCEDPTVFFHGGKCMVYYTGWNAHIHQSKLLVASGSDIRTLAKRGNVLEGFHHWNTKEATVAKSAEGWRLFFEYSETQHSLVGVARAREFGHRWQPEDDPFGLRADSWDCWHLSTGPIVFSDTDCPVMFYNGANEKAHWRIGWVEFTSDLSRVVRRSEAPLVAPEHLPKEFYDIAFSASAVEVSGSEVDLYYSVGDRKLFRAKVLITNVG